MYRLLLFCKYRPWIAKDKSLFDVTESFDDPEISEIIGLHLLNKLSLLLGKKRVGFFRDNHLTAISSCSGTVLDKTRKNIISLLKTKV